jgi:hypothetical protein
VVVRGVVEECFRDREKQDVFNEASMDGFTAVPEALFERVAHNHTTTP